LLPPDGSRAIVAELAKNHPDPYTRQLASEPLRGIDQGGKKKEDFERERETGSGSATP